MYAVIRSGSLISATFCPYPTSDRSRGTCRSSSADAASTARHTRQFSQKTAVGRGVCESTLVASSFSDSSGYA